MRLLRYFLISIYNEHTRYKFLKERVIKMFKCYECEATFSEPRIYTEKIGEHFGFPAYESFACCPECGGSFDEATQCKICGEWFFDDELDDGICEECLVEKKAEYRYNVKACFEVLKDETMQIEINPVLAILLKRSEIEEELLKILLECSSTDCSSVISKYEDWFIDEIKKGVQE